jgi:hypothetical protein
MPISEKPTALRPGPPRTPVISTRRLKASVWGTGTVTSGWSGTSASTERPSRWIRTELIRTGLVRSGRSTSLETPTTRPNSIVADWPTAVPNPPVTQAVRWSPSKA